MRLVVVLFVCLLSLNFLLRMHEMHENNHAAPSDDQAYSLQGKHEDVGGASIAFPGGGGGGGGVGSSSSTHLVLWDTEYTTWEGAHQRKWQAGAYTRPLFTST